ncbi:hypothetical protein Tco_0607744 [Tanacetum coccineum]
MIKSSNGDTPFSFTYGTEAVIPAEIGMPTLRIAEVDLIQNNEALEINLGLLEERREQATIREAKSKAKMEKYYNSKVRSTSFKPGDLVYRNNEASHMEDTRPLRRTKRRKASNSLGKCKSKMEKYYNSKVQSTSFKPGDLVYRKNDASRMEDTRKLGPKWEGPYKVTEALGKGAYKLRDHGGMELAEAKVVDRAVVVTEAAGTTPDVLASPIKLVIDKGSDKGVQTPTKADRYVAMFSLICSTRECETLSGKVTRKFHHAPLIFGSMDRNFNCSMQVANRHSGAVVEPFRQSKS